VLGEDGRVVGLRMERTRLNGDGSVSGTGEFVDYPVQAVYHAVGYLGSRLPELPFDDGRGVIPNVEGRVVADNGAVLHGLYATGWIKRGPVGLIGHTKSDAMETISHLVNDQASWWSPSAPEESAVLALLEERGVEYTDLDGWHRLDEHEIALGEPEGRARIKVVPRDEMVRVARGG
jgi:ferredoxin--NADP+ reductase